MHGRGNQKITSQRLAAEPGDRCPDCCSARPQPTLTDSQFSVALPNTLPDACGVVCHELSERLTAIGNYLGALQRLLEIGYRRGQPLPAEVLEKVGFEVARAGDVIHQFRRMLAAHSKA